MKVFYTYSGSGNKTITLNASCESVGVVNNGAADMTFSVNGIDVVVPAGTTFNDIFDPFKKITFAATDVYNVVFRR